MTIAGAGPLYRQAHDILLSRIRSGEWKPGQSLPSETRLARELSVSQGTVRKALGDLVVANVLIRQQGKGTFVATHDARRALFHFFHIADDRGLKALPESRTLSCRERVGTRRESTLLELRDGARVVRIERTRSLGGRVVINETVVLPAARFAGIARLRPIEVPNTLYELYERDYGVTISRADERLKAVAAGSRLARLLDIEPGTPLLEIERVAFALDDSPVELRTSQVDTSRHHYGNTLL